MPVRNIEAIQQQIDNAAAQYDALTPLRQANAISLWSAMKAVFAFGINYMEQLLSQHQTEINTLLANQRVGTAPWYVQQVRNYQHGDLFSVIDGKIGYAQIDESKRIIAQVSCKEDSNPGQITIKVLKKNAQALSSEEMAGLITYINKVKIIGTRFNVVSLPAEKIKLQLTVEIDRQVFNSNGADIHGNFVIKKALQQYLSELAFDDVFYLSQLTDKLQSIKGVKDVAITQAKQENNTNIDRKYAPQSGHLTLHDESRITYVFD